MRKVGEPINGGRSRSRSHSLAENSKSVRSNSAISKNSEHQNNIARGRSPKLREKR